MKYLSLLASISALLFISCACEHNLNPEEPEPLVHDTVLFRSSADSLFRIPAIAVTRTGELIALGDHRFQHGQDVGLAKPLDIMVRRSVDNGKTWTKATELIRCDDPDYADGIYGFGDASMVADRESDEVLIMCVGDREGVRFGAGGRLEVHRFASVDGGKTFAEHSDLSDQFYGISTRWSSLFIASGKIFQSRVIKVGKYYRLYCAALVLGKGNYVFYSDDFGRNWTILGTGAPCPNGDEAKVEELPNGSVILSSRTSGGRYFNIFNYSNDEKTEGTWGTVAKTIEVLAKTNSTNGEIMGIKQNDGSWLYLQSVPAGPSRSHVTIYSKWIAAEDAMDVISPKQFGTGWTAYEITDLDSAYSTMVLMKTGRIGFYYERLGEDVGGYDLVFASISTDVFAQPVSEQ